VNDPVVSVYDPRSETADSYTFVLVHGGCHDGSLWQPVVERLEQLGHTAYSPTVAGHGRGVPKNVTHAEETQSIVDFIVGRDRVDANDYYPQQSCGRIASDFIDAGFGLAMVSARRHLCGDSARAGLARVESTGTASVSL
jgi:hypothetical protein